MSKPAEIRCTSGNIHLSVSKANAGYDFDTVIDRYHTNSLKYDFAAERGYPENVLPLWVADMDFLAAPPVLEAMQETVNHGIFGYSKPKEDYYEAAASWFAHYFGWKPGKSWLVKTPGVVFALSMAVRAFTSPGDAVLIQTPVYYPFYSVITNNQRTVVENPLVYHDGNYQIDFDDFEEKIREYHIRLFILCSPHNPTGRVWKREELQKLGEICQKYQVIVISDEIHCDFVLPGNRHYIFSQACPELAESTVICTAPSKTFNLAGLQISNIWVKNPELRRAFKKEIISCGYTEFNLFGLNAAKAAYQKGHDWHERSWEYIQENLNYLRRFLERRIPEIRLTNSQGTYFAWLDCSGLGLDRERLNHLIVHDAGLWLDAGHIFGEQGALFQRIVLACPRAVLRQALHQLENAVRKGVPEHGI